MSAYLNWMTVNLPDNISFAQYQLYHCLVEKNVTFHADIADGRDKDTHTHREKE